MYCNDIHCMSNFYGAPLRGQQQWESEACIGEPDRQTGGVVA